MLSQGTGYAATALAYAAAAGGRPVLVREMAEAADIPAPYLAKIVHALSKRGLVITQRGIGGGVSLARPAHDVTLLDLCEALADPVLQSKCLLGTAECSDDRACPAHRFWVAQRGTLLDYLRSMTVADVAAFETRRRWKAARRIDAPEDASDDSSAGNAGANGTGAGGDE